MTPDNKLPNGKVPSLLSPLSCLSWLSCSLSGVICLISLLLDDLLANSSGSGAPIPVSRTVVMPCKSL